MSLDLPSSIALPRIVPNGEDRNGRPVHFLNGIFYCKVSATETDGALCVFDTWRTEPGGPPLHVHHHQDEWFLVLEGDFIFRLDQTVHRLGPGDSILGPRHVPHCFRCMSSTGRMLTTFQPAGTMEAFFQEGGPTETMTPQFFAELSSRHGMTVVGPSLQAIDAP